MSSKHHKWQTRWRVDAASGMATHDSGLRVRLGQAENGAAVQAELARTHGPHNAPQMLERLLREARLLLAQAEPGPSHDRRR